ncbi:carotenoid oxygenase family protein [Massilia sp. YMA4]|uniref:carotenoid oxygenase family protein n=1 Tax=Massilia sp. YMA4 TaxID=1593482 RepID=UPI000DD142ED|nr:carotenoid oxygenase family protein [Massilia sp. YMA4]AXA93264.1 apocarotenoid-15,15'-oxygenase [Massilia sp. YMA4]
MDRRNFLQGVAAGATLTALPILARADETKDAYRAHLPGTPRLAPLAGCASERLGGVAALEGRWPAELRGTFYRNGPARFELGGERYRHWFDGDGMAHAWHIGGGTVRHEARFVRTQKYEQETAAGRFLYPAFDTRIARRPVGNNDSVNPANTNLVPHGGKLYALWEGGSATELDPDGLATRGIKRWRDDLAAMPFSAHPKITPDGTLWNFGIVHGANKLLLWRIDADGSLGKFGMLDVPQLPIVHDFVVTARYMVFLVPPWDVRMTRDSTILGAHTWNGARPLRVVVVDRTDFTLRRIVEIPAGMTLHLGNGWDEGDVIRLDACLAADDSGLRALGNVMRGEQTQAAVMRSALVTIDLARGVARSESLLDGTEFPRVAPADVGQRYRELFVTTRPDTAQFGMTGIARIDVESGKVDRFEYGADWIVEEHVPVPKASGRGVWLVGAAYDARQRQTVLAVFDGARLAHGPVARARLAYAAPLCFHGNFLRT